MVEARVPNVSFDWLAELPQRYEQSRGLSDRRSALTDIDPDDPLSLERAARKLLATGNLENMQIGVRLSNEARAQRELAEKIRVSREEDAGPPMREVVPSGARAQELVPFIKERATAYGINPDVAVRVAQAEGLANPVGDAGKSFGAFQLYTGGGLGNEFKRDTGLDPADPKNERATIDYALKRAAEGGWGPWVGARKMGLGQWTGIERGQQVAQAGAQPQIPLPPVGTADQPSNQRIDWLRQKLRNPFISQGAKEAYGKELESMLRSREPTELQKNYRVYYEQKIARGERPEDFDPWAEKQRPIRETAADKAAAEYNVKALGENYKEYREKGRSADTLVNMLNRVDQLIQEGTASGQWAEPLKKAGSAVITLGSVAKQLGIPVPDFKAITDPIKRMEELQALGNKITLSAAGGRLGAQFSDADRNFMGTIYPGLSQTPEGNRALSRATRMVAEHDRALHKIATDYMNRSGPKSAAELEQLINQYVEANPLFMTKDLQPTVEGQRLQAEFEKQGGGAQPPPPGAQPQAAASSGVPSKRHIDALRANPDKAQEFERHFNLPAGSAQQFLGGI